MKYLPLFFLVCTVSLFGQSKKKPNLKTYASPESYASIMSMVDPGQTQMDTIWGVVRKYCRKDKDTCETLLAHVQKITKNSENQSFHGQSLMLAGNFMVRDGRDSLGFSMYAAARKIFDEVNDVKFLSGCDAEVGSLLARRGEDKEAAEKLISAISLAKSIKDSSRLARPLNSLAGVYFNMQDYEKAEEIYTEAYLLAVKFDNLFSQTNILVNRSSIASFRALDYQSMADSDTIANPQVYRDSARYLFDQALEGGAKAMAIAKKVNHNGLITGVSNAIGGIMISASKYKEAEEICRTGLRVTRAANDKQSTLRLQNNLVIALNNQDKQQEALVVAKSSREISNELDLQLESFNSTRNLYNIYKKLGLHKQANIHLEEIVEYMDETNKLETKKAIAEVEIKYETAEKEKQILVQKNDILELASENAKIQKQKNYLIGGGLLFSLLGFIGYRFNKIRKDRNDKKEFAEALIFAQEEERKRIARDLHDGVGQSLLLIKKELSNTKGVTEENQQMIADTLEEVRSISRDLHPFQLDKFGLTATINGMISKVEASTELFVTKNIEDIDKVLPAKSEIHLYRTIQEALSNIVKHAQATAAKVSIKNEANQIKVLIQDNGKGFDLELAVATSKSLGIRTMHERIGSIGGQLKIENGTNGGTQLEIVVPK